MGSFFQVFRSGRGKGTVRKDSSVTRLRNEESVQLATKLI